MARRTTKRITLLIGAPIVLAGAVFAAKAIKDSRRHARMDRSLAEGTAAYKAGDYPATMEKLGYYVGQNPNDGEAMLMDAEARRKTPLENRKHVVDAIPYARRAAENLPGDPRPLELLIDLYAQVGFYTEQVQAADRLLKINPRHADALEARANALAVTGKLKEAMEAGRQRIAAYPDDVDPYAALVAYQRLDHADNADTLKLLDEAAAAHPDDGRFFALKAREHARTGDMEGAAVAIRTAVDKKARSAAGVSEILAVLDILSPYNTTLIRAADEFLSRELSGALTPEVAVVAAERAWKEGRLDLATQTVKRSYDPAAPAAAADDALGWSALLNLIEARSVDAPGVAAPLAELKKRTTDTARYWAALIDAQNLLFNDKFLEARARLATARTLSPKSELVEYLDADTDQRLGEWRQAATRWSRLLSGRASWRTLNLSLVSLYLQHRDVSAGVAAARRVYEAHPGSAEAILLARAYAMEVEVEEVSTEEAKRITLMADDLAAREIPDAPLKDLAQSLAARMYLGLGRTDLAAPIVQSLVTREPPPSTDILMALGTSLRLHDPDLADKALARAGENAQTPDIAYQSALRLAGNNEPDQGRALLQKALDSAPAPQQLDYELRLVTYLDFIKSNDALARLTALAEKYKDEPFAQTALLESQSAWADQQSITAAIERLKSLTGDSGNAWKMYKARSFLTFNPGATSASDAYKLLTPVIAQEPRNITALLLMADAQILLGDRPRAIQVVSTAVDADPERPGLYPRLIDLLQQAGRADEATARLTVFSRLTRMTPDLQRRRARLLAAQGMWEPATTDLAALAALGKPDDRFAYASMLARRGDADKARLTVDELASAPTLSEPLAVGIAEFYATLGDVEKGRALLDAKLPAAPADYKALSLARYLLRHRAFEQAEPLFVRLAESKTPESLAELATFYFQAGRADKSREVVEAGLAANPKNPRLTQLRGIINLDASQTSAQAMADFVAGTAGLDSSPALQHLAQAMQEHQKSPEAGEKYITALTNVTREAPSMLMAWRLLVETRLAQGQQKDAADAARAAVKANPVDPAAAQLATQTLMAAGQLEDALAMANEWRARAPQNAMDADLAAAAILASLGNYAEAAKRLSPWQSRILSEADTHPAGVEQLTQTLAGAGNEAAAREIIWPLADRQERWAARALLVIEKLNPAQQTQWFAHLEPILTRSAPGRVALGQSFYALGVSQNSATYLDRAGATLAPALDTPQTRAAAAMLMGGVNQSKGDTPAAIASYRTAVAARPDDPISLNNLAYLLIDDPATQAEAVTLARKAVEISTTSQPTSMRRNFLDTLGLAQLKAAQFSGAEDTFRKALALDSRAMESTIGLAEATLAQNKPQDARKLVDQFNSPAAPKLEPALAARLAALREKIRDR